MAMSPNGKWLCAKILQYFLLNLSRMLFHFHKQQSSKTLGSVHATYLLSGLAAETAPMIPTQNGSADGEDSFLQSSPSMSGSMLQKDVYEEPGSVKHICVCREEDLEGMAVLLPPSSRGKAE